MSLTAIHTDYGYGSVLILLSHRANKVLPRRQLPNEVEFSAYT